MNIYLTLRLNVLLLGVRKKTEKLIKSKKLKKKLKKPNREKKLIKLIRILKKPTGSVSVL